MSTANLTRARVRHVPSLAGVKGMTPADTRDRETTNGKPIGQRRRAPRPMTADRPSRARLDLRHRVAGQFLRLFNPLARRLISAGVPTGAPNILLTVRGRRTGKRRTIPVGMLELDGRWFVQASYSETGWVDNLRAAGEATVTHPGGRRVLVQAVELPPDEAGVILRGALQPFRRWRFLRPLLGPNARPPIMIQWRYRFRIDDTLEEYIAEARRHPIFELRPMTEAGG
jgi:deazaflavin-dependent oxidoreductase (nitroreductase family)